MRPSRAFLSAIVVLLATSGCRAPITQLGVPLEYRPTNQLALERIGGSVTAGQPLAVAVSDDRQEKAAVGRNLEKEGRPIPILAERQSPEQFVAEVVSRELGKAGVSIAPDSSQAHCTLRLAIARFWTEESSLYRGSIAAKAVLVTKNGKSMWSGDVVGESKRFGRSLSTENYQQTFSDAALDLVSNLLRSPGFRDALPCVERSMEEKPRRRKAR